MLDNTLCDYRCLLCINNNILLIMFTWGWFSWHVYRSLCSTSQQPRMPQITEPNTATAYTSAMKIKHQHCTDGHNSYETYTIPAWPWSCTSRLNDTISVMLKNNLWHVICPYHVNIGMSWAHITHSPSQQAARETSCQWNWEWLLSNRILLADELLVLLSI